MDLLITLFIYHCHFLLYLTLNEVIYIKIICGQCAKDLDYDLKSRIEMSLKIERNITYRCDRCLIYFGIYVDIWYKERDLDRFNFLVGKIKERVIDIVEQLKLF